MSAKFNVLLINGPNLNMLGIREPGTYGARSLVQIVEDLNAKANALGMQMSHIQSNAEYEIIDAIHQAYGKVDFIIINPAAFTHTSIAIRDALLSVAIPFIEVHLSNVHARETFRHHSYFSDIAQGVICGFGDQGYAFAVDAAKQFLEKANAGN
ncbi:type II 3-dehydroquinate dehydratase [Thalassotalea fusca]